jgi:protocatechuate 3,4-dioxygenase beta subunit
LVATIALMSQRHLRRREALALFGGTLAAPLLGCGTAGSATGEAATTCILSPEVTEGPYWIDGTLTRRNITEGRRGLPLILDLSVVNAKTCSPIAKADVEIWHCDAVGEYSGFDGASSATRYLRGHQKSDAQGELRFVTIYPGWYRGRTPHIHLKVHVGGDVVHTGQLFMSEKTTAAVYRHAPYSSHGQPDTSHASDNIYAQAGGSKSTLKLRRRASGKSGYAGTITLGVAT